MTSHRSNQGIESLLSARPRLSPFDEVASSWRREHPEPATDMMVLSVGLVRLGRMIESMHDRMTRQKFGITATEMRVLFALRRAGRPFARRPTDLFRAVMITSGAISKQVDRLVAKALVIRTPDPFHRGGFLIKLTAKGVKVTSAAHIEICNEAVFKAALESWPKALQATGEAFVFHLLREIELEFAETETKR